MNMSDGVLKIGTLRYRTVLASLYSTEAWDDRGIRTRTGNASHMAMATR